jgi:hypothetical protein
MHERTQPDSREAADSMTDNDMSLTDQVRAASDDARQRLLAGPGGPARENTDDEFPSVTRLREMLRAQLAAGFYGDCGHFRPRAAQVVNWFPAIRDVWQCDPCAQLIIDDWLRQDYSRCDLCHASLDDLAPVLIHQTAGMVIIHAVLCASCAPEGST